MKVWNFIPAIKLVIRHQLVELSLCLSKKEVAKLLHVLHGRIFQTDKLVQVYIECRNQLKFHGRLFTINILTPLSLSMLSTFVILLDLILVIDPKLPRNRLTSSFRVSHLLYTCCCWDQSRGVTWNPTHNSMAEYSEKKNQTLVTFWHFALFMWDNLKKFAGKRSRYTIWTNSEKDGQSASQNFADFLLTSWQTPKECYFNLTFKSCLT